MTLDKGYKEIAEAIRASDEAQKSPDAARTVLASLAEDWLLLVDGVDDVDAVAGWWPLGRNGNILYTSQNPVLKDFAPEAVCEVAEMEECEAVELLLAAARLRPTTDKVTRLAKNITAVLGHLALAIDQARGYIARGECRIYDFLEKFERHHVSLLNVDAYHSASPYKRAVYATWELSFSALQRKRASGQQHDPFVEAARNGIQLLAMLAYFHYEDVTEDTFKRAAENYHRRQCYPAHIDPNGELAEGADLSKDLLPLVNGKNWDAQPLRRCISLLMSYLLLSVNPLSGTISMHRLVHQ